MITFSHIKKKLLMVEGPIHIKYLLLMFNVSFLCCFTDFKIEVACDYRITN